MVDPAYAAPVTPEHMDHVTNPEGRLQGSDEATLLTELAAALAAQGAPAHRLEDAVSALAKQLGVKARFFAMPTAVFATFEDENGPQTTLIEVKSSDVHLERLVGLDRVLNDVWEGKCTAPEGIDRIRAISVQPNRYPAAVSIACFALVSAMAARFFGGGLADMGAAGAIGLLVGVLCDLTSRRREYARVLEFVAGIMAVLTGMLLGAAFDGINPQTASLAGVIFLLPGLTLTMAVTELSTRNWVAGSSRLVGAMTILVMIGFGVAMGQQIGMKIGLESTGESVPLPEWTLWASLAAIPPGFVVLFRALWRDLWIMALAALTAFLGARLGSSMLGAQLGVCVGALLVGMLSNGYARVFNRPAVVASAPGILLLVPGAIGFQSMAAFSSQDALEGITLAVNMMLVAAGLVTGLLLANVALPPRKAL